MSKRPSLYSPATRSGSNCFVIREHTIETESSRGPFGVKLLVLAALGGPLAAEFRYFYGCGRYVGAKARYGKRNAVPDAEYAFIRRERGN